MAYRNEPHALQGKRVNRSLTDQHDRAIDGGFLLVNTQGCADKTGGTDKTHIRAWSLRRNASVIQSPLLSVGLDVLTRAAPFVIAARLVEASTILHARRVFAPRSPLGKRP